MKIKVSVGETADNLKYLNLYLKNNLLQRNKLPSIFQTMQLVQYRSAKTSPGFCQSKAIVSTAGCMIGSYDYTSAARKYNQEHNTLFSADTPICIQLLEQLEARWNRSSDVVYYGTPPAVDDDDANGDDDAANDEAS